MSAIPTMVAVLKCVPTLQLGASRVHAMLAILSTLMAVHVIIVGHTYHTHAITTQNETSLCLCMHFAFKCSFSLHGDLSDVHNNVKILYRHCSYPYLFIHVDWSDLPLRNTCNVYLPLAMLFIFT